MQPNAFFCLATTTSKCDDASKHLVKGSHPGRDNGEKNRRMIRRNKIDYKLFCIAFPMRSNKKEPSFEITQNRRLFFTRGREENKQKKGCKREREREKMNRCEYPLL